VDGLNRQASADALAKVLEPAETAYRSAGKADHLRIEADGNKSGSVAKWLLASFQNP
jgi:hypothetical protein